VASHGGLGTTADIASGVVDPNAPPEPKLPHAALDQFRATAIAGNDLLSSCLYTAGICAQDAGRMAPISLALVSFMLFFFRYVYSEVVTALPVNGGSYNALLNTTNKRVAALAACLSIISYVATAVVSGCTAIQYLQAVWPAANLHGGTVGLLGVFAVLTLAGVGESAIVAVVVFSIHVFTLILLLGWSFAYGVTDGWATFTDNWTNPNIPYPDIVTDTGTLIVRGNAGAAIFFGYASALLGITGFETAANYVEEMRDSRTYVATLRNMWWGAALFNPLISLLAMAVLPMSIIQGGETDVNGGPPIPLLASLAQVAGGAAHGTGLKYFVCIDGAIVLAGSVLTAYVGVMGLIRRMAQDRCLPSFLMTVNKSRGTPHWIIATFFVLTSSLFLLLYPPSTHDSKQVDNLAGVYDIAFLTVMSAFAVAAIILKVKRPDLPRLVITSWPTVLTALALVLVGLAGTLITSPRVILYFLGYFGLAAAVVFITFMRARILKFVFFLVRQLLATSEERARMARRARKLQRVHQRLEEVHLAELDAMETLRAASATPASAAAAAAAAASRPTSVALTPSRSSMALHVGRHTPLPSGVASALAARSGSTSRRSSPAGGGESDDPSMPLIAAAVKPVPTAAGPAAGTVLRLPSGGDGGVVATSVAVPHVPMVVEDEGSDDDLGEFEEAPRSPHAAGGSGGGSRRGWRERMTTWLTSKIRSINAEPVVYFAKDGDLSTLNRVVRYVRANETSSRIVVVHVMDDREAVQRLAGEMAAAAGGGEDEAARALAAGGAEVVYNEEALELVERLPPLSPTARLVQDCVALLDTVYPSVRIDCIIVRGTYFSPHVVQFLTRYLTMTANMMFISMPDERFPFMFSALGGVRVITRSSNPLLRSVQLQRLRIVMHDVAQDMEQVSAAERRGRGASSVPASGVGAGGTGGVVPSAPPAGRGPLTAVVSTGAVGRVGTMIFPTHGLN